MTYNNTNLEIGQAMEENVTTNISHLIKILVKNLQTDPVAPIREYISNSHDATRNVQEPIIQLWCENNKIHIRDNGCGMNRRVIKEAYTRIAGHYSPNDDLKTIGMFGIGVLSAFIVAEKLVVETRSQDDTHGWRLEWKRYAETFTLEPIEKPDFGTEAMLLLDEDNRELASDRELEKYINRTFGLFNTPVYVGNPIRKPVNQHCIWLNNLSKTPQTKLLIGEDIRKLIGFYFRHNLLCAYFSCDEEGNRIFLGIPDTESAPIVDKHSVCFFSKGVLVHGNMREFFPQNLSFVVGLIDSPHFKLQITREEIFISDQNFSKIKSSMEDHIIRFLELLAINYPSVIENVLHIHKTKMVAHGRECDALCELFRDYYHFTTSSGQLRWRDIMPFAERRPHGSRIIYFTSNEFKAFDDFVASRSFLTIYAFGAERNVLEQIASCEDIELKDIATLDKQDEPLEVPEPFRIFANHISTHLGRKAIRAVVFINLPGDKQVPTLFRIVTSDGVWMHPDGASDASRGQSVRIDALMLNIAHPIIGKLAGKRNLSRQQYQIIAETLYQIAVLHSPFHDMQFSSAEDIIENLTQSLEMRIGAKKIKGEYGEGAADCFVALPYKSEFDTVWQAIFSVLSKPPYNWKVVRADKDVQAHSLIDNIRTSISISRRFIADISGLNPNVLIEVGLMLENDEDGLLLICDDETQPMIPIDLRGKIFLIYPAELRLNPHTLIELITKKIVPFSEWIAMVGKG